MYMRKMLGLVARLTVVAGAAQARASIQLNEIFVNPSGTDNGFEFLELRSTTGGVEAMTGLTLLVIEGESGAGTVDVALDLGLFSTGTNGLFLWRDAATVLQPPPALATTLNIADFNPDLENGSQTYMLVTGWSGAIGTDYDTDNNGIFDSTPWTSVIDAMGYLDSTGGETAYGTGLGFVDFPAVPVGFDTEAAFRLSDSREWLLVDVSGTPPGPFALDGTETITTSGATFDINTLDFTTLSPGNINPRVPEPSSLGLLAIGLVCTATTSRRRRARA